MFTPIGFFAPSGFTFGGVTRGVKFAIEAEAGSTFVDTSGQGITFTPSATSNGGIVHTTPTTGSTWYFNPSTTLDTNYVESSYSPASGLATFSYSMIVRWQVPNPAQTNQGPIASTFGSSTTGISLFLNPFNANSFKQTVMIGNAEREFDYNTGALARYKWWMISGTKSATTWRQYANTTQIYTAGFTNVINPSQPMSIHRHGYLERSTEQVRELTMGAFVFYDVELTAAEIATNYVYFQTFFSGL